ncbi:VIT1/CCC1 transporter family protein [Alicyclobacillus fastidiosus]|uniref:VIT1/CCC1 transporter family protein n=1 Tax=Alicyclobacillus fastidiosus TaxID=392011 RepID=A0ABV5AFA0_9BACL|nr:VIT1/CCC1 transporter family protein [Alicyclobacillus fastidiosus]WEH09437.1 VIT1/CCC1 transporter family protein [Alicyclobacillus fastidiosus]
MSRYLEKTLRENLRRELQAAKLYEAAAARETDGRRREILLKLADVEYRHAGLWKNKLTELGAEGEAVAIKVDEVPASRDLTHLLGEIERIEQGNDAWYQSQRNVIDDPEYVAIYDQIDEDEKLHADIAAQFGEPETGSPKRRLKRLWSSERWHKNQTSGWLGDAIYGVNDGLGALFGIIAGVAGYTSQDQTILVSGLFGALASTLSMGAGAWLAAKSENELMDAELHAERMEIEEDPEHEIEELALIYELKGFAAEEAARIARQIASDQEQFLTTMAQEELGIHETSRGNPWRSALFGGASTLVGAVIPLIPFFFMSGAPALAVAAIVSIVAHFVVGALKSRMTVRGWWISGLEMTLVGVIVGGASYALGELGRALIG